MPSTANDILVFWQWMISSKKRLYFRRRENSLEYDKSKNPDEEKRNQILSINSLKEEKAQNILKNYTNLVNRLKSSQKDSTKESQFQ